MGHGQQNQRGIFGQAEKYDLRYGQAIGVKFKDAADEAEFTDGLLSDILKPEQIAAIKRDGIPFGKWARFRNLYRWNLTAAGEINLSIEREDIPVTFINGEYLEVGRLLSEEFGRAQSPLPRNITLGVIKMTCLTPMSFILMSSK